MAPRWHTKSSTGNQRLESAIQTRRPERENGKTEEEGNNEMSDPAKIRGFQPSYSSFLATSYHELFRLWIAGDIHTFWRAVKGFLMLLPTDVKELINPEVRDVEEAIQAILRPVKTNWYMIKLNQSKKLNSLLAEKSLEVLDHIMLLLDQKDALLKGGRYLKPEDFRKLEEGKHEH